MYFQVKGYMTNVSGHNLALLSKLSCSKIKTTSGFSQVMGLYSVFVGVVTQLCSPSNVCVEHGHTLCAYIKFTIHLHHAQHGCSVFTALWCGCFVVKLPFYFHQTPSWLWLV